jgi:type VI secretion system protein ImpJ
MSQNRRVVWSEGMLLAPQHFQQWDRYVHHLVRERFRGARPFDWGFLQLEVDQEALRSGRIALAAAKGVMPDGTPFAMPDDDSLPPARSFDGHFGPRMDALQVALGLPAARLGRPQLGEVDGSEGPLPRYSPEVQELPDDNSAGTERLVTTGRRNFALLFPDDALGDYDTLPVAQVTRTADGGYALRESDVPPCLAIGASEALMRQLRTELQMLVAKSLEIGDQRRNRGGVADFSSTDTASFMMLHTVNGFIPALSHYVGHRRAHPEDVYLALSSLVGMLTTFVSDIHPKDLPAYEHRDLGATFAGLHRVLARLVEVGFRGKAVRIDLEKQDGFIHVGRFQDARLLEPPASVYLGVKAEADEQVLITEWPRAIKIAALDRIDFVIARALPGVPLIFTRVPPPGLPVKSQYLYFQLDAGSELWEGIKGAKNLAIYAPAELPGLTLELLALRE